MVSMAFERTQDSASAQIENPDEFVCRAGGQIFSVRREIEAEHDVAMDILELLKELAVGDLPNLKFTAAAGFTSSADEAFSIRGKAQGVDAINNRGMFVSGSNDAF